MRLLLVVVAVATLGGCRFWYKPVPVANAIGEEKTVLGVDTLNVYRDERFEVYGPNPESVYDGYEQLNRAYRSFERYFGIAAPRLALVLAADTTRPLDVAITRSFTDRGFTPVRYTRPRGFRNPSRYGALGYGGVVWPIAPTAARVMLARFAESQRPGDGGGTGAAAAELDRFPVWFRAAVMHVLGEPPSATNDLDLVREKRASLIPLHEVLTLVRPAAGDSAFDPSRRRETDDQLRLLGAEAGTVARFLIDREGPDVIGRLARGYLASHTLSQQLGDFRQLPHDLLGVERRWHVWIDTVEN